MQKSFQAEIAKLQQKAAANVQEQIDVSNGLRTQLEEVKKQLQDLQRNNEIRDAQNPPKRTRFEETVDDSNLGFAGFQLDNEVLLNIIREDKKEIRKMIEDNQKHFTAQINMLREFIQQATTNVSQNLNQVDFFPSTTTIRTIEQTYDQNQKSIISLPYATILKNSDIQPDAIKHIEIIGCNSDEKRLVLNRVKNIDIADQIQVRSIKQKSKYNLTVKCLDGANAELLENRLRRDFPNNLNIKAVQTTLPEIKVVRIQTTLNAQTFFKVMLAQNQWISPEQIQLKEFYEVKIRGQQYHNLVLSCNHTMLETI